MYSGLKYYDEKLEIQDSIARISKKGYERIIRAAFELAKANNREKVTMVQKAKILKIAGATFLNSGIEVAKDFPDIPVEDIYH